MYELKLQPIPNQRFSVTLFKETYHITIKTSRDLTLFSLSNSTKNLINNVQCYANQRIETYGLAGNGFFAFVCEDNHLPDYRKFGVHHRLYFVTEDS